jgi:hypothetical protein
VAEANAERIRLLRRVELGLGEKLICERRLTKIEELLDLLGAAGDTRNQPLARL